MTRRAIQRVAVGLSVLLVAGCATSRAIRNAEQATRRGDHDAAVAYYRQAYANDPSRLELRIQLERATRQAAAEHVKRARDLEAQDQLAGALAEYRLAADLDPASTIAASKATELDRRIRSLVESARPQPRIETLRQQAAQASPIPRLDPRAPIPQLQFTNAAVRDVLRAIADLTGINIQYDMANSGAINNVLSQPYSIDVRQISLEDVLNQVMQAATLTFKVVNPQTIFVYQDTPQNRLKYEDQYIQTFYLSHANPKTMASMLTQIVSQTGTTTRPVIQPTEEANTIVVRASVPMLELIEAVIRSNDRPIPEVMIEAEILEVDRVFIRQLGIDLSQYSLGFTFSPELAPPNSSTTPGAFPTGPPPFNLNTISRGTSAADFYLTSPTALVRLLESNSTTRVLAKPQSRGRAGEQMNLSLGDSIPIPQTTFQSVAAGGFNAIPTTQVQYTEVGVNLSFVPRVTYQDEIILEQLILEKSGLGAFIEVAGQSFPTIVRRRAQGSMRLRDGESNLVAGLLRDDDRKTLTSLPGIAKIPILRSLFGNSDRQVEQTDIIMIITPHIVRSRDLTSEDLKPRFVGTGQNIGGSAPSLISLESIGAAPGADAPAGQPAAPGQAVLLPAPGAVSTTPAATVTAPGAQAQTRAPGVVPIEAVPSGGPPAPGLGQPAGPVRVVLTAPTPSPDGSLASGGGPYTVPITISGAPPLSALTLTIVYNPGIMRTPTVTQGTFMSQGGVAATYVPSVDATTGRIDIAFARPSGQAGAANSGLLAAIAFVAGNPGTTDVTVTGVATSVSGQTVPIASTPIRLVVK